MSTKFGLLIDFDLKAAISTNTKPEIVLGVRGCHLDKAIWRYMSAVGVPIWTKFSRLMQNRMQIMEKWSRSEPEVEFQYGGRLFFQTRSRCISAINWSCWPLMTTKFGLLIDFDFLKARTSTNTKPEVVLSDRGRHLEKLIWCHISAVADPEWHVNNGDEVKIETEKSDGLKGRNFSLVVQACKSGCYSYVRGCVLAGVEQLYTCNLLTAVLAHYTHS